MDSVERFLDRHRRELADRGGSDIPAEPSQAIAIVSCMDCRVDLSQILGLRAGEAHVLRNAGGVVTDDVVRSLAMSQRLLNTREVMVIMHTDCGMMRFTDDEMERRLEREVGVRPPFSINAIADLEAEVRRSVASIRENPFLPHRDRVRGFVYEVESGRLREIA